MNGFPQTPSGGSPLAATVPYLKAKGLVHTLPEVGNSWPLSHAFNSVENVFRCLESQRDGLVKILQLLLAAPWSPLGAAGREGRLPCSGQLGFDNASAQKFIALVLKKGILISFFKKS